MQLFTFRLSRRTPPPPSPLFPDTQGAEQVAALEFLTLSFGPIPVLRSFQTEVGRPRWTPPRAGLEAHFRPPPPPVEDSPRELLREQGALLTFRLAMEVNERGRTAVLLAEWLREKGQMLRLMLSSAEAEPLPLLRRSFLSFSFSFSSGFFSPTTLNMSFQRLEPDAGAAEKAADAMTEAGGGSAGGWTGGGSGKG